MGLRVPYISLGVGGLALVAALFMASQGCGSQDPSFLPDPAATQGTVGTVSGSVVSGGVVQGSVNISTDPVTDTTITDASGAFTLAGLPPGRYTVIAEKAGFIRGFEPIEIRANTTSRADLEIFPATGTGMVVGQVTEGAFGLSDVLVVSSPATQTVITTGDGRYSLTGPPGQYVVRARRNGYGEEARSVRVLEGRSVTQNFALGRRADGVLTGQATDNLGQPLNMARVDLFRGSEVFTGFTDVNGNYSFTGLTTDFYVVSVEAPGFLPGSKGLEVRGGAAGNGDVVLYLTSTPAPVPGSITGTVRDALDRPVSGITLTLSVASNPASALTQADGRFTFVDVPAGPATLMAVQMAPPPGGPVFAPANRQVTVGSGQTADGDLTLQEI